MAGKAGLRAQLKAGARLLGLLDGSAADWLRGSGDVSAVERRIGERALARKERRFTDADRIRA